MTTILAIDTATGPCSVAVWHEESIVCTLETDAISMQSAVLMPMVEQALKQAQLGYGDLNVIAATTGPGSFTAIRTGLASANAIAFSARLEKVGYTTLEVLAYGARAFAQPNDTILSILNAGKGECYYQFFTYDLQPFAPAGLAAMDAIEQEAARRNCIVAGNISVAAARLHSGIAVPRAILLAELCARASSYSFLSPGPLHPFYIRPPDAKLPDKK